MRPGRNNPVGKDTGDCGPLRGVDSRSVSDKVNLLRRLPRTSGDSRINQRRATDRLGQEHAADGGRAISSRITKGVEASIN